LDVQAGWPGAGRARPRKRECILRVLSIIAIVVLTALVLVFVLQNLGTVSVDFLTARLTLPLSVLVPVVYLAGMLTGGFVVNLVRSWLRRATADDHQGTA
jgi:lipopolysaccharide assembly protein A